MVEEIKQRGWKAWPSWVKGGLIGLVLAILFAVYILFFSIQCIGLSMDGTSSCPTGFKLFMFGFEHTYPILLMSTISAVLIGALIGLIVGKIKSRKMKK